MTLEEQLKKVRLDQFLFKVDLAYRSLCALAADALCAPGIKGMLEELLDVTMVPYKVLVDWREGIDSTWEKGWPIP